MATQFNCRLNNIITSEYFEDEVADTLNIPEFTIQPKNARRNKFYYGVRIVTGDQADANPESFNIVLFLHGNKGKSGDIVILTSSLYSDGFLNFKIQHRFQRSHFDDLVIESDGDLGDIQVVGVYLRYFSFLPNIITPDWFIDYFTVKNYQKSVQANFPRYHWIGQAIQEVSCTSATATLKQVADNPILVEQRNNVLEQHRKTYKWQLFTDSGVPSAIDKNVVTLPLDENFERAKLTNFIGNLFTGFLAGSTANLRVNMMHALEAILKMKVGDDISLKNLHDFEFIATTIEQENLKDASPPQQLPDDPNIPTSEGYRWTSDVEFGRQILNGVNPVVIKKCTKIPENFAVTSAMVKPFMYNGKTLEEEMEAGHVYICDLSEILHGLATRKGYFCPEPFCLLYVNGSKQLVPIAIQLKRDPGVDNPVFLPSDSWFEWLLAKIYYRSGDAQHHQISSHYISCHATMEAYGVATMRNLPDAHPVYKLLQRHFRYTMSINSAARATLINQDGIISQNFSIGNDGMEELMKRSATAYRVQWTNIKKNLKERGVDNSEELPGYYYRDDGIRIWDAIEEYVKDVIDIFYKDNEDVQDDTELAKWTQEIHELAFPGLNGAPEGHGFPEKIQRKEELVEYCTTIIFTGSAQHAAVNFGQFDIYGYTPNAPIGMRKEPPKKKRILYRDLMEYLPDINTAAMASTITFSLAQFSPDEVYLGDYPECWYTEQKVNLVVEKFAAKLKQIEASIIHRNKTLGVEYFYLCPSKVPNSITI